MRIGVALGRFEFDGQDGGRHQGQAKRIGHPVLILEPPDRALGEAHEHNGEGRDLRGEAASAQEEESAG